MDLLHAGIRDAKPGHRIFNRFEDSNAINVMLTKDGYLPKDIKAMIDWLYGPQFRADYATIVLSGTSLREKAVKIQERMAQRKPRSQMTEEEISEDRYRRAMEFGERVCAITAARDYPPLDPNRPKIVFPPFVSAFPKNGSTNGANGRNHA